MGVDTRRQSAPASACLYSLRAQTRPPDEILVINNASTDDTRAAAAAVPGVTVVDEPIKGLVVARETARERRRRADPVSERLVGGVTPASRLCHMLVNTANPVLPLHSNRARGAHAQRRSSRHGRRSR
jgi:glycosyl transferase family 2